MMKRRGFLGFLAGGAVAGPGLAKQAVAESIGDLGIQSAGILATDPSRYYSGPVPSSAPPNWIARLLKLNTRSQLEHAFHRKRTEVYALDPDLHSYRSFAMHAKISLQRERNYIRGLENDRSWIEGAIAGWFDE